MKQKLTISLFWYLFLSFLHTNAIASSHSLYAPVDGGNEDPVASVLPYFSVEKDETILSAPFAGSDDFIIRRKVDFEKHSVGMYTDAQYKKDWNGGKLTLPNTTQIQSIDGTKVLASYFKKGTWGSANGGINQWGDFKDSPDDITELYWTFRIKYQNDFDWALGNKLPGVGFGTVKTAASGGSGPNIKDKGASLRLMQVQGGKLKLYVYHHSMREQYGDDMGAGEFGQLKKGVWQELTVRVVANDNGKANGIMQVWLDGALVASVQNIEMRKNSSPQKIGGIMLNTFMGGGDSRFAPDKNQFMWMDDFHYWQYSPKYLAANPGVARGLKLHPASHKLYTPLSGSNSNSNAAPTVSVSSPTSNSQFTVGSNVSIEATAADSDGTVAKVEFYNGSTLLGTDTSAPYSYNWTNVKAGDYNITAKATDNKGATTTSSVVKIKVTSNASPTVSLTSPKVNSQFAVGSSVSIAATAADRDGTIAKVEFFNGTTRLGTDNSAPYTYTWTNVKAGTYSITAKATDNKGATTVSDVVRIEVGASQPADKSPNDSAKPGVGSKFLNGLVSFYEMNTNTSGVLKDSHGTNHGKNTAISHVNGVHEKGNRYDGASSISQAPHSSSLNLTTEFTLMADVYREGPGQFSGSVIVGKTYSTAWPENEAYSIAITEDNKIRIRTNIGYLNDWISTKTVPQGKWVRIIATYKSGEGYSLYLDTTTPEKSPKASGTIYQSNAGLIIGASTAGYRRRVQGILDNVAIWNRQLTPDEIKELINTDASYPDFVSAPANVSPTVSLTSPISNSQFAVGASVSITATAADTDGTIAKVEFFNGTTLLGTDTSAPYSYTWTNVKAGEHSITAKVTDNKGATTNSDAVKIKVVKSESVSLKPGVGSKFLNGLVSFYEMNTNTSGVLKDSHGTNHGKNTAISHVNGVHEKGNKYDGASSISQAPHSSSLNLTTEFTLMADVYREGPGQFSGSVIVGKTYSTAWPENEAYSMAITEDNRIRIRTNIGYLNDWISTKTVPQGKWVRIIATYKSGEGYSLYLDTTTPEKSPKASGTIYQSNQGLIIGASTAGYRRRVEGILDNVAIWNRQLTPDEIKELINTDASYPDFVGGATYRITVATATDELMDEVTEETSVEAQAGEKMVFFVEEEQKDIAEFDHWSVDGVQVSDQALFELDMPKKDIVLTKHFKTSEAREVNKPKDLPEVRLNYAIGPNPAMDHLNIMFTNLDGEYDFQINVVSMSGLVRKTLAARPEGSSITIDVSDLTNGVYVLQLTANGNAVASKKFMKF
jgi:hypothetical protein